MSKKPMTDREFELAAQVALKTLENRIHDLFPDQITWAREEQGRKGSALMGIQIANGTIEIHIAYYWARPEAVSYFVNVKHDEDGFVCNVGTPSQDRALLDVGAGIEFLNERTLALDARKKWAGDLSEDDRERLGDLLVYQAFKQLDRTHFEVSALLSSDDAQSLKNYADFKAMLVQAHETGRQAALEANETKMPARPKP